MKTVKKCIATITTAICLCMMLNTTIYASHSKLLLTTGYTETGVYYEVYVIEENELVPRDSAITITHEVIYDGIISPPAQIEWSEKLAGLTYSGMLYLQTFHYENGKTVATYKGTLISQ